MRPLIGMMRKLVKRPPLCEARCGWAAGGEAVADFVGFGVLHRADTGEELAAVAVQDVLDQRRLQNGLRAVAAPHRSRSADRESTRAHSGRRKHADLLGMSQNRGKRTLQK
jgi:hypothetical protein